MKGDYCRGTPEFPCGGCGGHHHPLCPLAPPEYKAAQMERVYRRCQESLAIQQVLVGKVTFWQGKHALLRHENNQLRRKRRKRDEETR